jgi:3'-phosphoadenosine 5'-phosphosulfate sulfotransferase (PAPS reductase)/FAD synthetase
MKPPRDLGPLHRMGQESLVHVYPVGDYREHDLTEGCWCCPSIDDGVAIHHAMDERERYETGELRAQ